MPNALQPDKLNVRMYNVGFGDCFLLSFPHPGGHRHVLVDCGAHPRGTRNNLRQVAANVSEFTGGKLAAVVATHRHLDHVSGFDLARKVFEQMQIDEIWLPWVESGAPEAKALWRKQAAAFTALERRIRLAPAGPRREAAEAVWANLTRNEAALEALRSQFGAAKPAVRYLAGGDPDLVGPAGIERLTVNVLGPPRSQEFLQKMNPPRPERWELAAGGGDGEALPDAPFDAAWEVADGFSDLFTSADRERLREQMANPLDLAFALDDAVNNTSLALLFQFGGQGLLMTGDAQWGNWKFWMEGALASEVLEKVTLYKVSHHGSENATPRSLSGRLAKGVAVLVPTFAEPFPSIPDPTLIQALVAVSDDRLVRSDAGGQLPDGFSRGDFWIDYTP